MDKPTDDLVRKIAEALRGKGWQLCVAESVTVGNLQSCVGRIPGASDYFAGGITVYDLDQKVRQLGVDRSTAEKCNCVSSAVAEQMAAGVAKVFHADIAIATTGYAEPELEQGIDAPYAFLAVWQAAGSSDAGSSDAGPVVTSQKVEGPPFDPWLTPVDRRQFAQQYFSKIALGVLLENLRPTSVKASG